VPHAGCGFFVCFYYEGNQQVAERFCQIRVHSPDKMYRDSAFYLRLQRRIGKATKHFARNTEARALLIIPSGAPLSDSHSATPISIFMSDFSYLGCRESTQSRLKMRLLVSFFIGSGPQLYPEVLAGPFPLLNRYFAP